MKLTNIVPTDWRNLQFLVSEYFKQAGYNTEVTKKIQIARGSVEVDVYVKSEFDIAEVFIVECKFWETNIPQEKVHAFRTVVSDSGASLGIMITKTGYQSGAKEASTHTNVKLLTWDEFLEIIKDKWVKKRTKYFLKLVDKLALFSNKYDAPIQNLTLIEKNLYLETLDEYSKPFHIYEPLGMYSSFVKVEDIISKNNLDFDNYESFFDSAEEQLKRSLNFYFDLFHIIEKDRELPEKTLYDMFSL